jgi:hypothetical protein
MVRRRWSVSEERRGARGRAWRSWRSPSGWLNAAESAVEGFVRRLVGAAKAAVNRPRPASRGRRSSSENPLGVLGKADAGAALRVKLARTRSSPTPTVAAMRADHGGSMPPGGQGPLNGTSEPTSGSARSLAETSCDGVRMPYACRGTKKGGIATVAPAADSQGIRARVLCRCPPLPSLGLCSLAWWWRNSPSPNAVGSPLAGQATAALRAGGGGRLHHEGRRLHKRRGNCVSVRAPRFTRRAGVLAGGPNGVRAGSM